MTLTTKADRCTGWYVSGFRIGRPCPYEASVIIGGAGEPFKVCGYHARQYAPTRQYPMWANLAQLRRLQMANLDRVLDPDPRP